MPIYEYHCEDCNSNFTITETIAEKEKGHSVACTKCDSNKVKQLFTGISLNKGKSGSKTNGGCTPGCSCGG